jgi:hypothetical protein
VSFRREGDAVAAVRELQGTRLAGAPVRIEFSKGVSVEHSLFVIIYVCFFASKISSVQCSFLIMRVTIKLGTACHRVKSVKSEHVRKICRNSGVEVQYLLG